MEKQESEDEDSGTYHSKPLLVCDSPSNISVSRTKSRSCSRSHSRSRSRSSSPELEVDSPPPPRISTTPITDLILNSHSKKSEAFSVSALLRDDQPKTSKSPASSNNSFENIRPPYPHFYDQNMLSRPLFHPFPLFAMLQQQGQQQQQPNAIPQG